MPSPLFNITPLLKPIAQNALILTPNNRLKNKVLQAYNQHQLTQGLSVWSGPRVHSLQQWLGERYQTLLDGLHIQTPKALASELVRRQIWLDIIAADNRGAELINPLKLASDAETALQSILRWCVDPSTLSEVDSTAASSGNEQALFSKWAEQFLNTLEAQQLHTAEQLQVAVNDFYAGGLNSKQDPRDDLLIVLGFDDVPPLTQQTFERIAKQHYALKSLNGPSTTAASSNVTRSARQDFDDELKSAARWSRDLITRDPSASVGIIVPNLGQCRAQLERTFVEIFEPHYLLPEVGRYTLPFNFSAGIPLGQTALIHDTLSLLRLSQHSFDTESLIRLLHSPFWGQDTLPGRDEFLCDLAIQLKRQLRPQIKAARVRQLVHKLAERSRDSSQTLNHKKSTQNHHSQLDAFATLDTTHTSVLEPGNPASYFGDWLDQSLQDLEAIRRRATKSQSASRWSEYFLEQLNLLGWPGERRLDSNEYQQMQQWFSLLEDFTKLDQLPQPLTLQQALEQLSQLANSQHYQAQTPDSPIQILGILEGAGLAFSHCWVMGMNQRDWPPAAQPNPLLPLDMQRTLGMPHADAERELQYAERLTAGYQQSAGEVIFSYSQQDAGTPLQLSALIEGFQEKPIAPTNVDGLHTDLASYIQALTPTVDQTPLEWVNCAQAPRVNDTELKYLRGGSSIFRNQAICPFTAFAIHRLGASMPLEPSQGLSPIVRGEILHNSLESLWNELNDQATLIALEESKLLNKIKQAVNVELLRYQQREPELLGSHYLELELERQSRLILGWCQLEKGRPAFSVEACEESLKVNFNGLPLTLRLDRLDRLESGELIVIDYKTGSPNVKKWGGERPEEPQLPLYALLYNKDVHALMFAEINAKAIAIKGLGQLGEFHDGISPAKEASKYDLPEDWTAIIGHWQRVMTQLSGDFLQGDCSLSFKSPQLTRYYTDLAALMRNAEQNSLINDFTQRPTLNSNLDGEVL